MLFLFCNTFFIYVFINHSVAQQQTKINPFLSVFLVIFGV